MTLKDNVAQTSVSFSAPKGMGISSDTLLLWASRLSALTILVMLGTLVIVLIHASIPAIKEFGAGFITKSEWRPKENEIYKKDANGKMLRDDDGERIIDHISPPVFGALSFIWGTVISSIIALIFAVPLSLGAAVFLVRLAHRWVIPPVSFLIEFLAAIPSIAYGVWGLFVLVPVLQGGIQSPLPSWMAWTDHTPGITWLVDKETVYDTQNKPSERVCFRGIEPLLKDSVGRVPGFGWLFTKTDPNDTSKTIDVPLVGKDMFAGGLILAIMIIPIITAISRDVLRQVPRAQVEGSIALGATWWQSIKEMLKFSRAALFGAVMLGLARAAGETMAVTMLIGNANRINLSPFEPAQTMSSLLASNFKDPNSPMHASAMTSVALILLVMSLLFNVIARYLVVGKNSRSAAAH